MRVHILRNRLGVPGVGRRIVRWFQERGIEAQEVVCGINPRIPYAQGDVILNYGRSQMPIWAGDIDPKLWLNKPEAVGNCVNKIKTLALLSAAGVPCLDWTTNQRTAMDWMHTGRIFARKIVQGSKGKGIEICTRDLVEAPLYTLEFPNDPANKLEFRIHVLRGEVIDYVQKKRMGDEKVEANGYERNDDIRNHANGWVFAHKNLIHSDIVEQLAIRAAEVLGVDFCGVDIIADYNGFEIKEARVCEVNSAPNMTAPTTINAYMDNFTAIVQGAA